MRFFQKYVLCFLFFAILPFSPFAQKIEKNFPVSWTIDDTTAVVDLINEGYELITKNSDSALALFQKAVYTSLNMGFNDGVGYALGYIGFVQAAKGNVKGAFATYAKAVSYCKDAQYLKFALPSVYINMAVTYRSIGRYELSGHYYNKALTYLQQNLPNDINILIIYNNLAGLHASLHQISRAMMYARKAEHLSIERNNSNTLISSKANIGALYIQMKMPDSALYYLEEALQLARNLHHTDKVQYILTSIGELYTETGQLAKAIEFYEKAINLSQNTNLLYSSILPSYALGAALMQAGQYKRAESVLLKALQLSDSTGIVTNRTSAYKTLSGIYEATHQYKNALSYYQKYEQLNDSLSGVAKAAAISDAEIKYQVEQKDKLIAENSLKLVRREKELAQNKVHTLVLIIAGILLATIVGIIYYFRSKMDKRNRHMMYLKALMEGEEKERDRVARELHDGIGGMLTVMQLNIGALMKHKQIKPTELTGLSFLAIHIGEEVHKAARNLTPQFLQHHNLYQAVLYYCEQFEKNSMLRIQLEFMGATESLSHPLQLIIFRIIQELIQNIYKHAGGNLAIVQLRIDGRRIYLSAEDNGCGFNPDLIKEGLGLQHIRNRVSALNGFCSIESMPGNGTAIYIEIDQNEMPR